LPKFIYDKVQEMGGKGRWVSSNSQQVEVDRDIYSFHRETSTVPTKDPQLSLEEWNKWIKNWKREEEKRRKEQRAKERLRLREERLRIERQREERLRREQQLREEKLKHQQEPKPRSDSSSSQQKTKSDFWGSLLSNSSSDRTYVQGYRRKDGTYVKGHYRNKY
jgi:hypothetical protein